jgi:serine/threonine protein kinase
VLGDRYRIRSALGAGGMGEVWHAFDLKLRVEVALKGVRPELVVDETRRESLRSEVRAAREVVSPNVCRVFDLIEIDGQELVSMEYVDGTTLLEVLRAKAPLDPPEAQEIASQFLAGLEAIHQASLVHRDVKPENIMVTRTGRVVVMDFGLARSAAEGAGTVSGTRAYMAPEQAEGVTDARSDLFSAGVILAEMVSPGGIRDFESRKGVWDGVRSEPVQVPDSPWAPVVKRAVAKDPGEGEVPGRARSGPGAGGGGVPSPRRDRTGTVPWFVLVRRGGCGVLLRPRGRGRGGVAEAGERAAARDHRGVGIRQELVHRGGAHPRTT